MSVIHNIIYKHPLEISRLEKFVSTIDSAKYEDRGNGIFFFWIDGKSARGFDVTLYQGYIEVRNTILSNQYDYELTNKIVTEIIALTDGMVVNQDSEQVFNFPLFNDDKIRENEINDCKFIHGLSRDNEDIAIYGPIRKVHFGKRLYDEFKDFKGEQLRDKILGLVLYVNYQLPNFEYGNIMQVEISESDKKIMKLLTNETNYIIDKYDYILLHIPDDLPIMITNEILNTMLPINWKLIDEYTIVAPVTEKNEWNKLLKNAKKFDLMNEFMNNK